MALLHENDLVYLLNNMDKFWHSDEAETVYKYCKLFLRIFTQSVFFTYIAILLVPIFILKILPFNGDYPVFPYSFWIFSFMQLFQFTYDVCIVLCVDCFFLCVSFFVYMQFKILNERFAKLGFDHEILYSEAKICVKYHKFLLR